MRPLRPVAGRRFRGCGDGRPIASGPGFWTDWLAELDRQGLLEELLAEDVIARALRRRPGRPGADGEDDRHRVVVPACSPRDDRCSRRRSACPACTQARRSADRRSVLAGRRLLGEQVMKKTFELDAAVADADLGIGLLWKGLRSPPSTAPRWNWPGTACSKTGSGRPRRAPARCCGSPPMSTATFRWIGAAIGGYHDGETPGHELEDSFTPGILNLADRDRYCWIRYPPPARPGLAGEEQREIGSGQDPGDSPRWL